MKKIRVLQFPISMNSGVTQYAMNNWKFISKDDFQFDFAMVRENAVLEAEIKRMGAGVKHIFASADRDRETYIREAGATLSEGYDVVHLHTSFWKRLLIEELAVQYHVPKIIVHSHSAFVEGADPLIRQNMLRVHLELREQFNPSLATDFWACSKAAADWLFGDQIPREKIKILKNAIDAGQYRFDRQIRERTRKSLGLDGKFVMGHVGRFAFAKNHEFLMEVFREVSRAEPEVVLLLVGAGPLESDIQKKAEQAGLSNRVIFAGQRKDVPALLQTMDVFCLPSRFEGLGIVLVEAQAAGLPCLISQAVPEEGVLTDLVTRLPLERNLWVEKIRGLCHEDLIRPDTLRAITDAGYNIKYQIREIERLYRE
ncbi:glycosyltransferase [Pseudoflavonifractor phocaeensis]|uniref:glycosyltransferase n=1 Tax=Pseudoflavonifractor phocaeensis TaxID=1870988 RepID=UPI00195EE418|nr:glycosyltransferase [Pseudoflavonifractor phocaeensis]MBM6723633.1 glycosyltransferase [Pseudoflavonifractor phocaeensis]